MKRRENKWFGIAAVLLAAAVFTSCASGGGQASPSPAAQAGPQRDAAKDLAEVFGAPDVTAAFNGVHAFLQTCNDGSAEGRRERIAEWISVGDWIDLPHLTVQGDAGGGDIDTGNVDLGENGKLLRLIVVGIDSFAATNKDAPAHIVFQFQNIPGMRRMNGSDSNAGGYKESEMRTYLTGNFLRGLMAAGVPEGVLYAPTRYIANGGRSATAADTLADRLWLPTEWELFGENCLSNSTWEAGANQARFEYYEGDFWRVKYGADGKWWWWLASPSVYWYAGSSAAFAEVVNSGYAGHNYASGVDGCAPAFCVR